MDSERHPFPISTRVSADNEPSQRGTVRFFGEVEGTKGLWVGVEWDEVERGLHNGVHNGRRYFSTYRDLHSGSFIRPHKLNRGVSIVHAIRNKYGHVEGSTAGVDEHELLEAMKHMKASLIEVVGFDKVNKAQSQFQSLRVVGLGNSDVNDSVTDATEDDLSSLLSNCVDLDISSSLVSDWNQIALWCSMIKRLRTLNVSHNRIDTLPPNLEEVMQKMSHIEHLVMGNMRYDQASIMNIVGPLINLRHLQVHDNLIESIVVEANVFKNLRELDLNGNSLKTWSNIESLANLPKLEVLNLCGCQLVDVRPGGFLSLRRLHLSENKIDSWQNVANLNSFPCLQELRFRLNPVLQSESGETCRQIIIASLEHLTNLNGTLVTKMERWGAEIDYMKMYGEQYLSLDSEDDKKKFHNTYPRYQLLVNKYGAPEKGEVISSTNVSTLKSRLKSVSIKCGDRETIAKKLTPSLTVQKLRVMLQRMYGIKARDMKLSYWSVDNPDIEVVMDNDLREISFYGIDDNDVIHVVDMSKP